MATAAIWMKWRSKYPLAALLDAILRGCGQVMFQNSALTGLIFFIAMGTAAYEEGLPQMAGGCWLGTTLSTLFALLLGCDRQALSRGAYGYNGCLIGAALPTFLQASSLMWTLLVFGSLMSVLLTLGLNRVLHTWRVRCMTFQKFFCVKARQEGC